MSDATMAKVLRKGGGADFTVHGFRSSFRDWAADNGFQFMGRSCSRAREPEQDSRLPIGERIFFEQRKGELMPCWASFVLGDKSNAASLADGRA